MDFSGMADWQKLGAGALPVLGFVFYQIWRLWKQDNKSDTVDARIQAYSSTLQTQADKLGVVIDQLRTENAALIRENAKLDAQCEILRTVNEDLKKRLSQGA